MPIKITDPDGQVHEFADGTPTDAINSQMQQRWASRNAPPAPPAMPPGMRPGNAMARDDMTAPMVPLSEDAQRYQKLLAWKTMKGDRAGVMGAKDLLEADPTYEMRKKQAVGMGENAKNRAEARVSGARILGSYAALLDKFNNTPDDVLKGAIGPRNLKPYQSWVPFIGGMTEPEAAASYRAMPNMTGASSAEDAWNAQNLFGHDVHGITNAFMTAGKGLNMSDERQKAFDATMRDFMKGTDRKSAKEVLDHAKGIIANDFNLTPEEADEIVNTHLDLLGKTRTNQRAETERLLNDARSAIQQGAPRDKVIERLRQRGIEPKGI